MTTKTKTTEAENATPPKKEYKIVSFDSPSLAKMEFQREWLIKKILVLNQPGVIGGPMKSLKTSTVIDMAISIATGKPFFGKFGVPMQRRVAVFSGESDRATIVNTAKRVCAARKTTLEQCQVEWVFRLPSLDKLDHRKALKAFLCEKQIKVVFFDPLYLCLTSGGSSIQASNLYDVGPVLWRLANACLEAGATPILVHHTIKSTAQSTEILNLSDLAFAGIAEFASQWVLLNHLKPYDPKTGLHEMVMSVGSRIGHGSQWSVTIEEGQMKDDFKGLGWDVKVGCFPPKIPAYSPSPAGI